MLKIIKRLLNAASTFVKELQQGPCNTVCITTPVIRVNEFVPSVKIYDLEENQTPVPYIPQESSIDIDAYLIKQQLRLAYEARIFADKLKKLVTSQKIDRSSPHPYRTIYLMLNNPRFSVTKPERLFFKDSPDNAEFVAKGERALKRHIISAQRLFKVQDYYASINVTRHFK